MKINKINVLTAFLCVGIAVIALFSVFGIHDLWYETFCAIIGVILTALVTLFLLKGQSSNEEDKEKNIKIYENKIKVYSEFVSTMWSTLENEEVDDNELRKLRSEIYNQLIFYINTKRISVLKECVDKMFEAKAKADTGEINISMLANIYTSQFSIITRVLREDINGADMTNGEKTENEEQIKDLWSSFKIMPPENDSVDLKPKTEEKVANQHENTSEPVPQPTADSYNGQFWHFTMWGYDQLRALKRGLYELSLIEYNGENWRTNLLKQAKVGDIVFLFRRGGWGYIGAYRVIGRRIMDFNLDCEEVFKDGTTPEKKNPIPEYDVNEFDYYKGKEDGADLCANLIVEQLAFCDSGVSYPGGVYRRTISRYDWSYGKIVLSRFMACVSEKDNFGWLNEDDGIPKEMKCNLEGFNELTGSLNIKPSARDANGNWID